MKNSLPAAINMGSGLPHRLPAHWWQVLELKRLGFRGPAGYLLEWEAHQEIRRLRRLRAAQRREDMQAGHLSYWKPRAPKPYFDRAYAYECLADVTGWAIVGVPGVC